MYDAILQAYLEGDQTALLALRDYALDEGMDDHAQMWETIIQGRERIDSLTPIEEGFLERICCYWIEVGRKVGPTNRALCELLVDDLYRVAGLEPPHQKEWVRSPRELPSGSIQENAWATIQSATFHRTQNRIFETISKSTNGTTARIQDMVWGTIWNHDWSMMWPLLQKKYGWVRFGTQDAYPLAYHHSYLLLGLTGMEAIRPLIAFSRQCGWWMPGKDQVILSDLPVECSPKVIRYADGFTVHGNIAQD